MSLILKRGFRTQQEAEDFIKTIKGDWDIVMLNDRTFGGELIGYDIQASTKPQFVDVGIMDTNFVLRFNLNDDNCYMVSKEELFDTLINQFGFKPPEQK